MRLCINTRRLINIECRKNITTRLRGHIPALAPSHLHMGMLGGDRKTAELHLLGVYNKTAKSTYKQICFFAIVLKLGFLAPTRVM